jgi:dTDP-4-amino-4,6-dideoxygalactose transaminase
VIQRADLLAQHASLADEIEAAVTRALRSGRYVLGPEVEAFEAEFAAYCGARHCVATGSGTDALRLALGALGIGRGDEVVTVSHTAAPTAFAIDLAGAPPRFVDVDPATQVMDPARAAEAIGPATRALLPVHLYGRCADVDALGQVAAGHGVKLVEDAAQAAGAALRGRRVGTLGDVGCFSFYPTKNLGALGDGGAVSCRSPEVAAALRSLRQYGWSDRYTVGRRGGRNSRLDELQAAMLRVKLPHVPAWNARRREIVTAYAAAAAGTELVLSAPAAGDVGHLAVGRHHDRDALAERLGALGVATAFHYPVADHRQPALATRLGPTGAAGAEAACAEVISLPCFALLSDAEVDRVCAAIRRAA